jgi:hypothetical protein
MYFLSSIHFLLRIPTSKFFIRRSAFDISFIPVLRISYFVFRISYFVFRISYFVLFSLFVPGTLYNSSPYFVLCTTQFRISYLVFRTS